MADLPFWELLAAAQQRNNSTLAIGLAPALNRLPEESQRWDEPFLPFGKAVIDTTHDLVCAYVFHLGAYLALGAAGAVALERTMAYVPSGIVKILHGPFASDEYVTAAFEDGFGANAVTLLPVSNEMVIDYIIDNKHGAFIGRLVSLTGMRARAGQIGLYYEKAHLPGRYSMVLVKEPLAFSIEWHTNNIIFASQGKDFRNAMRAAAIKARTAPAPEAGHDA